MSKPTKEQLIACAEDLNEVISDEVLVEGTEKKITQSIEECAVILEEEDEKELTKGTIKTLKKLGFWEFGEEPEEEDEPAPKKKAKKKAKSAPEPEEEDLENEDPEENPEEEDEPAPKKKAKKVKKKSKKIEDDDPEEEDEPAPKKKAAPKVKAPSPYGTTLEIMCSDPDMKKEALLKKLTKKGINIDTGKSGIQTGFGVVRKIVSLLRENGLME